MALGRLHVDVGVGDDILMGEVGGPPGAVGVLDAAIPDRLAVAGTSTH